MKHVPRTFFSTCLSGSDSLVKERIRNIVYGQRKRPPVWLMALVVLMIACCGWLVSCQSVEAAQKPSDQDTPDTSALEVDLNRNGIPETLEVTEDVDTGLHELRVYENGEVIFTETAYYEFGQSVEAMFLYRDEDGQAWLMRYVPFFNEGVGDYYYMVYCLDDENRYLIPATWLSFNINIGYGDTKFINFDPEAIDAYIAGLNALLSDSTLIFSADPDLAAGFQREGRLVDTLWWLDINPYAYIRDENKTLLENLRDFQTATEEYVSDRPAVPYIPEADASDIQAALAAYRAVLEGEATFYVPELERNIDMAHLREAFDPSQLVPRFDFTVMDMDGDGVPETILRSTNYAQWSLVLHWQEGAVYGYSFYIRWLNTYTLKEDGTFTFSSSAADNGYGKLRFVGEECVTDEVLHQYPADGNWEQMVYLVNGQSVTQAQYDAALERQDAKPDVQWYDFTPVNLDALFS